MGKQMLSSSRRRGFVLIIVLAFLGVLAFLALNLAESAKLSRVLSRQKTLDSQTYLLARSGIEKGRKAIAPEALFTTGIPLAAPHPDLDQDMAVTLPVGETSTCTVRIRNCDGRICLNDGIAAGKAEHAAYPIPGGYKAEALDPWPSPGVMDTSAWIHMRLRALLNAYGDVHRYAASIGWPLEADTGLWPFTTANEPAYGTVPFTHTSTECGDRFTSQPPRLVDGTPVSPARSAGLGDRIIGARPPNGYTREEQVREIVNGWAAEHLTPIAVPSYLSGGDFYSLIEGDITVEAWHDSAFWRMAHEFGAPHPLFPGHADFQNDFTSAAPGAMALLEKDPPDFTDIWRPHPVPPIHLNQASDAVRAAVFQAPSNISLICEGALLDTQDFGPLNYGITNINHFRPTLGVGGLVYAGPRLLENGSLVALSASPLTRFQRNRHLSVRDSLLLSRLYGGIGAFGYGWPDSQAMFSWHLKRLVEWHFPGGWMECIPPLERPDPSGVDYGVAPTCPHNDSWTLAQLYPRIFSLERRLPAWMGAPIALMSTWREAKAQGEVTRSIEDFVFKSHLPKISFMPSGHFTMSSLSEVVQGHLRASRNIRAVLRSFETTVLRDQASFLKAHDAVATSPEILIGPEPEGAPPSPFLGTVGLRDRGEAIPGGTRSADGGPVIASRYDFNATLKPHGSSVIECSNPAAPLTQSELEGDGVSIFPRGPAFDPSNLSPFGGIFLSSINHGRESTLRPFTDSFYFKPDSFLLGAGSNGHTGTFGNQGLVSLWVRVPSGYTHMARRNILQLNLWERVRFRWNDTLAQDTRLCPITLSLSYMADNAASTRSFQLSSCKGNASRSEGGPAGYPGGGYTLGAWLQLVAVPWLPLDNADYFANPLYNSLMFQWNNYFNAALPDWPLGRFTTHPQDSAREGDAENSWHQYGSGLPYACRSGSWMRVYGVWDCRSAIPGVRGNIPPNKTGVTTQINVFQQTSSGFGGSQNLFNPDMMLTFGERPYSSMPSASAPLEPLGTWMPVDRLNSCIDNVVLQFGGFPSVMAGIPVDLSTVASNANPSNVRFNSIRAAPEFDFRRYDIRPGNEPSLVVDPKFPAGSRILECGAGIHDVPYHPEYGGSWRFPQFGSPGVIRAPRVDIGVKDGNGAVLWPGARATDLYENTVNAFGILNSPGWIAFPDLPEAQGGRLILTYPHETPDNQPLDGIIPDIPWIQEVHWRWVPPGGAQIVKWDESE